MKIEEIKKFILSGCKFKYFSYDHKKALEEYRENYNSKGNLTIGEWIHPSPNCYDMPQELKDKYRVEKIGKLRKIDFSNNCEMYKFHIGSKYSKVFYADDFGVNVFPILE